MSKNIYLSYDADDAGSKIGRAILSDDPQALRDASKRIRLGNDVIKKWAK